jgi:hypothetical protein
MHSDSTLPRSPPLTCTTPAHPPPLSRVPACAYTTRMFFILLGTPQISQTCHRSLLHPQLPGTCAPGDQLIDTTSFQQHPHPESPCVFSVVRIWYWSRSTKRASARSVLRRRLGRRERDLRVGLPPPPSRARTQLPDLTPRTPTCGLGTDGRGAAQRGPPR